MTTTTTISRRFRWTLKVWAARQLLKRLTVRHVAVLAHVTGLPPASIVALHPCCRARKDGNGIVA